MAFDFLPDTPPPPPKPNTQQGSGGSFGVGKSFFIDTYLNHMDAHLLFSTPPLLEEFKLKHNHDVASGIFNEYQIKQMIREGKIGDKTDYDKLIQGYTSFQNPKLLSDTLDDLDQEIPDALFSEIEKPKLNINDKFGLFSFDLASMAMTYVYEYFEEKTNKKVDANLVEKRKNKFYITGSKTLVAQKIKRRKNGTPVVVSSVRNCFIDFEKQDKKDRSVEIIVSNSFAYDLSSRSVIFNSMAAIATAKKLLLKGFKVKITSLLAVRNNGYTYYHFVPVKRFNQPLDINAAAYVCGDSRFFRYQGFKMIIKGYDFNDKKAPYSLGGVLSDKKEIAKEIETNYVPNSNLKQADTRLYFGGSKTIGNVKKEVNQALEILIEKYGK